MAYTYSKTYLATRSALSNQDAEWLHATFGPIGNDYLFSSPRWRQEVSKITMVNGVAASVTIEYTFINREDYTLFVLACG